MRPRSPDAIAGIVGGVMRPSPSSRRLTELRTVVVDSRQAGPGALFVAMPGERRDGHTFVDDAFARGAEAAIVQRDAVAGPHGGALIEVPDPSAALIALARRERSEHPATVVGITGSAGKTCTKDFVAAVVGRRLRVVASPASYNNEVGLPLTMLSASADTEVIVCEMGARGVGHIRLLCEIARPHVGVVTNVGVAHMELFGSIQNIREAKAELPESLPAEGTAVLNADDPVVRSFAARTEARAVFFGTDGEVRAEGLDVDGTGRASFNLVTPDGTAPATLPLPGEHIVPDALAAAAVGYALGIPPGEAAAGITAARLSRGRMEMFVTDAGIRVVDDSYNANPASMAAALKTARGLAGDGRCIAVLGHMAELGHVAADEHEKIGELLTRLGIHSLVVVGVEARPLAAGAVREGLEPESVHACEDVRHALEVVRSITRPGDLVLVKGSRVARLERLTEALRASVPTRDGAGV